MLSYSLRIQEDKSTVSTFRKSPWATYGWHLHKNRDAEVGQMLTPPEMSHESRVNNSHQFLKAFTLGDPPVWRCGEMIQESNEVWRAHQRTHKCCMRISQANPNIKSSSLVLCWLQGLLPHIGGLSQCYRWIYIRRMSGHRGVNLKSISQITEAQHDPLNTLAMGKTLRSVKSTALPNKTQTGSSDTPTTNMMQKQKTVGRSTGGPLSSSPESSWSIYTHKQTQEPTKGAPWSMITYNV